MSIEIILSENEILSTPNNFDLGTKVRQKYFDLLKKIEKENNNIEFKPFVDEQGYDLCIVCGKSTPYKYEVPISKRIGYIEGAGQTCPNPNECK